MGSSLSFWTPNFLLRTPEKCFNFMFAYIQIIEISMIQCLNRQCHCLGLDVGSVVIVRLNYIATCIGSVKPQLVANIINPPVRPPPCWDNVPTYKLSLMASQMVLLVSTENTVASPVLKIRQPHQGWRTFSESLWVCAPLHCALHDLTRVLWDGFR